MRSFKEEYQREMDRVGTFHPDVKQISDEIHRHKLRSIRRKRIMISAASAAAVFLLIGGMATAMNYGGGIIRVRDNGFSITSENVGAVDSEETGQTPMLTKERQGRAAESAEPVEQCSVYEVEPREYKSLQDFQAESGIIVPLPELQLVGGDTAEQSVHVLGNHVYISVRDDQERNFSIMQVDHRNDMAYAAASSYSGEAVNERNYTTAQGYTYKVIDIMDGDELVNIECAVSLYGRDLLVGFYGYTQEEAYDILKTIDLGVYIKD